MAAGLEAPPRERGGGRGRGRGGRGRAGAGFGHTDFTARDPAGTHGRPRDLPEDAPPAAGSTVEADEPAPKRVKLEDGSAAVAAQPAVRKYGDDRDYDDASADEDEDEDGAPEEASAKPDAAMSRVSPESADQAPPTASVSDQLARQPDGAAASDVPVPAEASSTGEQQKRFQVVCRHWRRGNCALGDAECPYLHHVNLSLSL